MKTLELKKQKVELATAMGKKNIEMDYKDFILTALDNPPEGQGLKHDLMRKRRRVENALNTVVEDNKLNLEDADAVTLKEAVADMGWAIRHVFIEEFLDDVDKLLSSDEIQTVFKFVFKMFRDKQWLVQDDKFVLLRDYDGSIWKFVLNQSLELLTLRFTPVHCYCKRGFCVHSHSKSHARMTSW